MARSQIRRISLLVIQLVIHPTTRWSWFSSSEGKALKTHPFDCLSRLMATLALQSCI